MKYDCYRRVAKKEILRESSVSITEALNFFKKERFAFVRDAEGNFFASKEELINAKSIRPEPTVRLDYEFTDDGQILENTDPELPGSDSDNAESSSECDN
jgi:hypothetical protein